MCMCIRFQQFEICDSGTGNLFHTTVSRSFDFSVIHLCKFQDQSSSSRIPDVAMPLSNSIELLLSPDPESSSSGTSTSRKRVAAETDDVVFLGCKSPAPVQALTTSTATHVGFDIYDQLFPSDDEDDDDNNINQNGLGFSKKVKKAMDYSSHHNNLEHSSVSSDQSDSNTRTGAVASRNAIRPSTTTTTNQALPTRPVSTNSSNRPTQVDIHSLLYQTKWDEAMATLSDHPQLAAVDEGGYLPLYIALSSNAPLNLIQTLIQAHPRACRAHHLVKTEFPLMLAIHWKKTDLTLPTRRERDVLIKTIFHEAPHMGSHLGEANETVLHSVLEDQPSLDIVQFLVDRVQQLPKKQKKVLYRKKDGQRQLPLHVAIEYHCDDEVISYLLDKYPGAVLEGRIGKLLPLHVAILVGCTSHVLDLLLDDKGREALWTPDEDGNIPLHLWFSQEYEEENASRLAHNDQPRHYTILSDEQVFEKIIAKLSLTGVKKLLSVVNAENRTIIEAAKRVQHRERFPKRLLCRMEEIMKSDQYEADTDDEKEVSIELKEFRPYVASKMNTY